MEDKPFSKSHVLKITSLHMKKAVDRSIRKTFDRTHDRKDMTQEIMETLDVLHRVRRMLEDFEKHNPQLYKGQVK